MIVTCVQVLTPLRFPLGVFLFCFFSSWVSVVMAQPAEPSIEELLEGADQAAQEIKTESSLAPPVASSKGEYRNLQETHRFILLISLMVVTLIVVGMVLVFFTRQGYPPEPIISVIGLVLVIQATSFLVVASLTSEQLTTAIGVLGAIAGYLFGSASRQPRTLKDPSGMPSLEKSDK